ncbi:MAG TPA: hypothetical protein DCL00_05045 [Opitutae bacterium]|nr:hypothetical protein [Opitutae bacterium]
MKYLFSSVIVGIVLTVLSQSFLSGLASDIPEKSQPLSDKSYFWTTDHMHVGVRWQPFGLPGCELYDANRPILSEHSSYAQFWVSWHAVEPLQENTDYENHMSGQLRAIENAVNLCNQRGVKVEFVMWHTPSWASESGKGGAWRPKPGLHAEFVTRIAKFFKGRVDAYQLYHEVNLQGMMKGGDSEFIINEIFRDGARAIRKVYQEEPELPVVISTSGTSPCEACGAMEGLKGGKGAVAVDDYYNQMIASAEMMEEIDALNMNVSDHFNGYGMMDGKIIPHVWGQYDLVRNKLDARGFTSKKILSSESWIVWDGSSNNHDVNGDGVKDEKDAYDKSVTIFGKLLERGLNTVNMPWCDNSSRWSMGLVKRVDYNGRVKQLKPDWVVPANDGGPGIITRKINLRGSSDDNFMVAEMPPNGLPFTEQNYINPGDPNHLHYYIWKWYSQISGGKDEVIRHAIAGESGNDIKVLGIGMTGNEQYRISSYNRTAKKFIVLIYSSGANGKGWADISIPSTIQNGKYYNNDDSTFDFRGEGIREGQKYTAKITTQEINRTDGSDQNLVQNTVSNQTVKNGILKARINGMKKFTKIEFFAR